MSLQLLLWIVNIFLIGCGIYIFTRKNLLSYFQGGKWWLTWLAVAVITFMDEFTSVFYAPSEAFRYIGTHAILFIPLTAILIHYMTTRMVEIAEILDVHNIKGGGVYNFSYLVLGPVVSFIAVASIMVAYTLTAAISAVSAVQNITSPISVSHGTKLLLTLSLIWGVAGLNISGIRNNARITFFLFLVTAVVFINLMGIGILHFSPENFSFGLISGKEAVQELGEGSFFQGFYYFIAATSSCILAYSGVESVLQTAGLVQNWKQIGKAYIFLAMTVGIVTPLVSVLVLSQSGINFAAHEGDLITHYATLLSGPMFGMLVGIVACITLTLAINTAFVASCELIERVCARYGFPWLLQTNSQNALYRIHIGNAIFFSSIILLVGGAQKSLAEMYAIGLLASFAINLAALLIYRYFQGTKEVRAFNVGRIGTLLFFLIIFSCFLYLSYHKPHGFLLWASVTLFALLVGIIGTRKKGPEFKEIRRGESMMDLVCYIAESNQKNLHVYFKRPHDILQEKTYDFSIFITFYTPRQPVPPRVSEGHFRIALKKAGLYEKIVAILYLLQYEFPEKNVTSYFGWPTSSWFDRLSTGVMVFQLLQLPKLFPNVNFKIEIFKGQPRGAAR